MITSSTSTPPGVCSFTSSPSRDFSSARAIGAIQIWDRHSIVEVPETLADDIVAAMNKFPTSYLASPYNVTVPACTSTKLTDCVLTDDTTTTTLVSGASSTSHLWASDRHLGPVAYAQIASQAISRAVNNPF